MRQTVSRQYLARYLSRGLVLFAGSLLLLSSIHAAPLPSAEFARLARACVPQATLETLHALAAVESAFNASALSINYPARASRRLGLGVGTLQLGRQPQSAQEALGWIQQIGPHGITVSVGLLQVNTEDGQRLGVEPQDLLDPCTNLRIGWRLFLAHYQRAAQVMGPGQWALRAAISATRDRSPGASPTATYLWCSRQPVHKAEDSTSKENRMSLTELSQLRTTLHPWCLEETLWRYYGTSQQVLELLASGTSAAQTRLLTLQRLCTDSLAITEREIDWYRFDTQNGLQSITVAEVGCAAAYTHLRKGLLELKAHIEALLFSRWARWRCRRQGGVNFFLVLARVHSQLFIASLRDRQILTQSR